MVLDSSAIVALVMNESESSRLQAALQAAPVVRVGSPTVLESAMVLTRFLGSEGRKHLRELLLASETAVISFTADHEVVAYDAFLRFGKGRHPAALNYGDCMSYAVAIVGGEALLFTGTNFLHTDVAVAK